MKRSIIQKHWSTSVTGLNLIDTMRAKRRSRVIATANSAASVAHWAVPLYIGTFN